MTCVVSASDVGERSGRTRDRRKCAAFYYWTRRERTRGRPAARPLSEVFAPSSPPCSGLTLKSGSGLPTNCAIATAGRVEATGCLARPAARGCCARLLRWSTDKTAAAGKLFPSGGVTLALCFYHQWPLDAGYSVRGKKTATNVIQLSVSCESASRTGRRRVEVPQVWLSRRTW